MKKWNGLGAGVQIGNFAVDEAAVPEALPKVPTEAVAAEKLVLRAERSEGIVELARPSIAVEEAEPQKIAVAEISERTEVWRV